MVFLARLLIHMNFLTKIRPWAVLVGSCTAWGCIARPPSDIGEAPPEILLEGVGFKFFRGTDLRAVGRASQATFLRDTGDGMAQNVRMRLLADPERPEIEIVTSNVTGNVRTQQATATGGVRAAEAGGAAGLTATARLDGVGRSATGDDPVDIAGAGYHVHADKGFLLNFAAPGGLALQGPVETRLGETR